MWPKLYIDNDANWDDKPFRWLDFRIMRVTRYGESVAQYGLWTVEFWDGQVVLHIGGTIVLPVEEHCEFDQY